MATFSLYQPYDLTTLIKDWTPSTSTEGVKKLSFTSGDLRLDLYASASSLLSFQDGRVAGAVAEISLFNSAGEVYRIGKDARDPNLLVDLAPDAPLAQWSLPRDVLGGHDLITGSAGNDILFGYAGNDTIQGGYGDDRIDAGAGDDVINDGPGSDVIDAGAGFDHVRWTGMLGEYKVARSANGFTVTSLADGSVDTVVNAERLDFTDKFIAADVAVDNLAGSVVRLYEAAFDRLPDAGGLLFWTTKANEGVSLVAMANGFIASAEYQALYAPDLSNRARVAEYYQHILDRSPDPDGFQFWVDVLDQHRASQAEVLLAISESPENVAGTATLIGQGLVLDYTSGA